MAYTINSAKDSLGNEQDFMDDFTRNQAAIEAHKRTRGGSYEDAYKAVTGKSWPKGRSVKVKDGRAEMTKDRTVKSVMGKYVLPAAAAALTGGAALGVGPLAGVFGGAAGGATGAGSTVAGLLPSSSLAVPLYTGPTIGSAGGVSSAAAGGGGFLRGLLGGAKKFLGGANRRMGGDLLNTILGAGGAGISGATQAAASNRGTQLDAAMEAERIRQVERDQQERQLIARSQEDRDSLTDAYIKSVIANRNMNARGYQPSSLSLGGQTRAVPSFGTGMAAPTDVERGDAQSLYDEVSKRLQGGSQLPPLERPAPYQNDPALLRPGAGERIGNWLGPVLGTWGNMNRPPAGPPGSPTQPIPPTTELPDRQSQFFNPRVWRNIKF